ncbi:MAG: YkgJ family cysteine cluster protein, partial [Acidobacteriota bacterium]
MRINLPLINPSNSRCSGCPALCCHDLNMPVSPPTTEALLNDLKWRLHFDTVKISIIDGNWLMIVSGRCIYLDEKNMCTIYEKRPKQCRDFNPPYCERYMTP